MVSIRKYKLHTKEIFKRLNYTIKLPIPNLHKNSFDFELNMHGIVLVEDIITFSFFLRKSIFQKHFNTQSHMLLMENIMFAPKVYLNVNLHYKITSTKSPQK